MDAGFLRHLARTAREWIGEERRRHALMARVPGSRIARPFEIQRPEALHAPQGYLGGVLAVREGG